MDDDFGDDWDDDGGDDNPPSDAPPEDDPPRTIHRPTRTIPAIRIRMKTIPSQMTVVPTPMDHLRSPVGITLVTRQDYRDRRNRRTPIRRSRIP